MEREVTAQAQIFNHRGQYMDPAEEVWSFAASAGTAGNLLVSGGNLGKVYFWDVRKNDQPLQMYEEAHTEAVTQVVLPSSRRSEFVVTASVDGLICVLNSNKNFEEDEDTEEVLSVGDSVAKIGFYGPRGEKLWNWEDGSSLAMFKDTRNATAAAAAASSVPLQTQYLIRCEYSAAADQLCLIGGAEGTVGFFPVCQPTAASGAGILPLCAHLSGGHADIVRAVEWKADAGKDAMQSTFGRDVDTGELRYNDGAEEFPELTKAPPNAPPSPPYPSTPAPPVESNATFMRWKDELFTAPVSAEDPAVIALSGTANKTATSMDQALKGLHSWLEDQAELQARAEAKAEQDWLAEHGLAYAKDKEQAAETTISLIEAQKSQELLAGDSPGDSTSLAGVPSLMGGATRHLLKKEVKDKEAPTIGSRRRPVRKANYNIAKKGARPDPRLPDPAPVTLLKAPASPPSWGMVRGKTEEVTLPLAALHSANHPNPPSPPPIPRAPPHHEMLGLTKSQIGHAMEMLQVNELHRHAVNNGEERRPRIKNRTKFYTNYEPTNLDPLNQIEIRVAATHLQQRAQQEAKEVAEADLALHFPPFPPLPPREPASPPPPKKPYYFQPFLEEVELTERCYGFPGSHPCDLKEYSVCLLYRDVGTLGTVMLSLRYNDVDERFCELEQPEVAVKMMLSDNTTSLKTEIKLTFDATKEHLESKASWLNPRADRTGQNPDAAIQFQTKKKGPAELYALSLVGFSATNPKGTIAYAGFYPQSSRETMQRFEKKYWRLGAEIGYCHKQTGYRLKKVELELGEEKLDLDMRPTSAGGDALAAPKAPQISVTVIQGYVDAST
eukprot:gene1654-2300_t